MVDIKLPIPKIPDDPDPMELTLKSGNQLFIVGPNGSGKSALIQRLVAQDSSVKIRRIAAHRQTWFDSGKIDLTPARRQEFYSRKVQHERRNTARWKDSNTISDIHIGIKWL